MTIVIWLLLQIVKKQKSVERWMLRSIQVGNARIKWVSSEYKVASTLGLALAGRGSPWTDLEILRK